MARCKNIKIVIGKHRLKVFGGQRYTINCYLNWNYMISCNFLVTLYWVTNILLSLKKQKCITLFFYVTIANIKQVEANPDAKRLYDDLLSNYNRLIRPVINNTETLTVWLGLKLSQLIEVNLKNQVMTTNLWVVQVRDILLCKVYK